MVRATFSGFSTALSALQANQKRLDIVGQNLSNMNTVGYTRQQLNTSSLNYSGAISHYMNSSEVNVGFGVKMDSVSQIRDPYLDAQYRSQMKKSSYNNAIQESFDSLANIFDESEISGIRAAFDDIKSTLLNMQDASKINDTVYETELRSRVQALTNLLNDAASQIEDAKKMEYDKLDGTGSSEQGAVQKVNDILSQIGNLNTQIKRNQTLGQDSLELQDERNVLLDELSSYIPIEVSSFKEKDHANDKNWPDDLKVNLVYTDKNGDIQRLTLINGSGDDNCGSLSTVPADANAANKFDRSNPTNLAIKFTAAKNTADANGTIADTTACASESQFSGGSIQAGLDMLGKTGTGKALGTSTNLDNVRGYQYYENSLNTLAKAFADTMNELNNSGGTGKDLLTYDTSTTNYAATIGINTEWLNGNVHISTNGTSQNDVVLKMIQSFSDTGVAGLGGKSYTDYMNNVSTTLANDSSTNQTSLKTNVTVLNSIQNSRDSLSGVSLDEEATNMMSYSSAYSAAARLMTTMDELIQTLLSIAQ